MIAEGSQTEAAVLITYSSVIEQGAAFPVPSRLSLLAALASRIAFMGKAVGQLWIAGEESYEGFGCTTGTLLVEHFRDYLPKNLVPVAFAPGENRLINTPYQVEALVEHCHRSGVEKLNIVGWGFHELRVLRLLHAYDPAITAEYSRVEDVLSSMDPVDLQEKLADLGFVVDFETIMANGMKQYKNREWATRQALLFNRKGKVINWLSERRSTGRYDDLDVYGNAIMGTTSLPDPVVLPVEEPIENIVLVD